MKNLLTLSLLLIYSSSFSQDIEQARWHIEQAMLALEEPTAPSTPDKVTASFLDSGDIGIAWPPFQADSVDIEFYAEELHHPWQHSVNQYLHLHRNPIDPQAGSYVLGVVENPGQYTWHIRMQVGRWESDVVTVGPRSDTGEIEYSLKVWGWWDSLLPGQTFEDYPHATTIKTYSDNVDHALSTPAKYVIPSLGLGKDITEHSEHKLRQMLRHRGRYFTNETRDRIPFVILQDEPDGWTQEQLELVIRLAGEEINPDLYYTYSFSGNHILNERPLPQNAKVIYWNHYPFKPETYPTKWPYVETKEDFMESFDMVVERVKANAPEGALFAISTQTFASKWTKDDRWKWQWRPPPAESPIWYAEAMTKHGFIGGLHYLLDREDEDVVAMDMLDLMQNLEIVFERVINSN